MWETEFAFGCSMRANLKEKLERFYRIFLRSGDHSESGDQDSSLRSNSSVERNFNVSVCFFIEITQKLVFCQIKMNLSTWPWVQSPRTICLPREYFHICLAFWNQYQYFNFRLPHTVASSQWRLWDLNLVWGFNWFFFLWLSVSSVHPLSLETQLIWELLIRC